jgi:two-component system sensor histidine kinase YesM
MMRQFFFKRWKTFFLIMLVPIIILSTLSTFFLYNESKNAANEKSVNTLNIIYDNLDVVLSSSAYQYELLTYNPRLVLSLEKILFNDTFDYNDVIFLNSIRTTLSAIPQSHEYIASIYLYLDGADKFYSSDEGAVELSNTRDTAWHTSYTNSTDDMRLWVERREYKQYEYMDAYKYITVFQKLANIQGVVVVNISANKFERVLDNAVSDRGLIFLLDDAGQILCSNNAKTEGNSFQNQMIDPSIIQEATKSATKGKWLKFNGRSHIANMRKLDDYGISFLSLVPAQSLFEQMLGSTLVLAGAILTNCVLSVVLAYIITRRNFQQIEHIIKTFDSAENGFLQTPSSHILEEEKSAEDDATEKTITEENITIKITTGENIAKGNMVKDNMAIENDRAAPLNSAKDEYDLILNNVITLFLQSSSLKRDLAENIYKQKLSEMAALQLQINPHFLFNTLQMLDFEVTKEVGRRSNSNNIIQNLSDILKYSLQNPESPVQLHDEIVYLKKYADIQKHRLGERFIIYYEIDETLNTMPVLRLLLQPLLENSIIHGIEPNSDKKVYIKIKAYQHGSNAYFKVIDNGTGLSELEIKNLYLRINANDSENIGLTNINRRLTLKYGNDSALHILSKKGKGTSISFILPIIN